MERLKRAKLPLGQQPEYMSNIPLHHRPATDLRMNVKFKTHCLSDQGQCHRLPPWIRVTRNVVAALSPNCRAYVSVLPPHCRYRARPRAADAAAVELIELEAEIRAYWASPRNWFEYFSG